MILDLLTVLVGLLGGIVLATGLWTAWRGRVAPWVPTPRALIAAHLEAVGVGPGDTFVDLGSGDGRVLWAAATRGARVLGLEIDPIWQLWVRLRWRGRLVVQGGDALASPPPPARWIWVYAMTPTLALDTPLSRWLLQARAQGSTVLVLRFPWPAGGPPSHVVPPPATVTREAWPLHVYGPLGPTPDRTP